MVGVCETRSTQGFTQGLMAATKPRDDCTHGVIISELVPQDSSTTPGQELKNGGAIFLSSAQ